MSSSSSVVASSRSSFNMNKLVEDISHCGLVPFLKDFIRLPLDMFLMKRDFYKQLYYSQTDALYLMMDTLSISIVTFTDKHRRPNRWSLRVFRSDYTTMDVLRKKNILVKIIFRACGQNKDLMFRLGSRFSYCFVNNMFNWTNRLSVGDTVLVLHDVTAPLFNYETMTPFYKTYQKHRKGVIQEVGIEHVMVSFYGYVVEEDAHDTRLLHVRWLPNIIDTIPCYKVSHITLHVSISTLKIPLHTGVDPIITVDALNNPGYSFRK